MGDPNFEQRLDHDQRDAPFDRVSGDRLDMGAFEYQIAPVDFTVDDHLNCSDVDALVAVIANGNDSPEFELTSDNSLDNADLEVWLSLAGLENLSSRKAYLPGDANLDGKVNPTDLNVVRANWLDSVTGWCSGDFTTNGVVNANDLNEVGLNWLQDVSGAAPRMPRAAFTGDVGHLMRRLVPDASVQNANQYTAPNQIVSIRVDAEKPIDQVMRRRSGRQTGTSESRASGHHFGRELTAIDQHVDSVFTIWDSQ